MSLGFRTVVLVGFIVLVVDSSVPPLLGVPDVYSIDIRRQTLQRNSSLYRLQQLSPEFCKTLSDEECLQRDAHLVQHSLRTRKLIQETGKIKPLVLCVRFSDHKNRKLPSRKDIDFLFNAGPGVTDEDLLPTGSVAEYLRQNSYGALTMEADVMPWMDTDNTESYYAAQVSGRIPSFASSMRPVLRSLDRSGLDFSEYDQDGDGVIDVVIMIHSGYPAEDMIPDCKMRSYGDRIWSHAANAFGDEAWVSSGGKYQLGSYVVASSFQPTIQSPPQSDGRSCHDIMARIGVLTHEFIHTWGLPDLYETRPFGQIGYGSGFYDIMSQPNGVDGTQTYPCNMSPWSKMRTGWLTPTEITHDGEYEIEPSATTPNVYVIRKKFPGDEYLLIENRQPIGFDSLLPGSGLLIWKIDDGVEGNNDAGYPGMSGWPGNGRHYRVALLQADRRYDLERFNNPGDSGDFWTAGKELRSGRSESEASIYSAYPNTNTYAGSSTGIRIYDISKSQEVMTFKVKGLAPAPPTFSPTVEATSEPTSLPSTSPSTALPTLFPSSSPTSLPTISPSSSATSLPTFSPTHQESFSPSLPPSRYPSAIPSSAPSDMPSFAPSSAPSNLPSSIRSEHPSLVPSSLPSNLPSTVPSFLPSDEPSSVPTFLPSDEPSLAPTFLPSEKPSSRPSFLPSDEPSLAPSFLPSQQPSSLPSFLPSEEPSSILSFLPSEEPSSIPSSSTAAPLASTTNLQPTSDTSHSPISTSVIPSLIPSLNPSSIPSLEPKSIANSTLIPSSGPPTYSQSTPHSTILPTLELRSHSPSADGTTLQTTHLTSFIPSLRTTTEKSVPPSEMSEELSYGPTSEELHVSVSPSLSDKSVQEIVTDASSLESASKSLACALSVLLSIPGLLALRFML